MDGYFLWTRCRFVRLLYTGFLRRVCFGFKRGEFALVPCGLRFFVILPRLGIRIRKLLRRVFFRRSLDFNARIPPVVSVF